MARSGPEAATVRVNAMSRVDPSDVELVQLAVDDLQRLAARKPVDLGGTVAQPGSLPSSTVVERAVSLLAGGTPHFWCLPYLIVPRSREVLYGSCGFKGAPQVGRVEISYGLASPYRGRGIGHAAVAKLLELARASGEVTEVIAHVIQGNLASERLVQRLGFRRTRSFIDLAGANVVMWTLST